MSDEVNKNVLVVSVLGIVAIFGIVAFISNGNAVGNAVSQSDEYNSCLESNNQAYCMCKATRDLSSFCNGLKTKNTERFDNCVRSRPSRTGASGVASMNEVKANYRTCKDLL